MDYNSEYKNFSNLLYQVKKTMIYILFLKSVVYTLLIFDFNPYGFLNKLGKEINDE